MRFSPLPRFVKGFLLLFFGAAIFAPLPFVVITPGDATNVMDKVITIKGAQTYDSDGGLYLLAIRVTSPGVSLSSPEVLYGWAVGEQVILPQSVIYPENVDPEVSNQEAKKDMTNSQDFAKLVAIEYLNKNFPEIKKVDASQITFDVKRTGGPSGGMIFTLAIIEKLTPQNLLQGRKVAVTGTIDADGVVGPIGGIEEKIIAAKRAGASLFLAPRKNCRELVNIPEGIAVFAVSDINDAVAALSGKTSTVNGSLFCSK